ncbi:MAG: SWIM zinc finger family protein [Streptosporangiaceae bacterium]
MVTRTRFGLTWWGQRWIAALEALGAVYRNRLPRGRTYARRGTVHDLVVRPGLVTARVQGRRASPYRVTLRLPVFDDEEWADIVGALAGQLRHAAALLDGRMPDDVDDVLADCGLSLFPHAGELRTRCSCPDVANPCKHVAAVHYVLAQTFDADPFLLPALRGRERGALLAQLRAARSGGEAAALDGGSEEQGVAISSLSASALYEARGDLGAVRVHPHEPEEPVAVLRRLGPVPGFAEAGAAGDLLEEPVRAAADLAWRLASEPDEAGDDPLLAALRERGSATSQELADALGRPASEVRAGLRPLMDAGLVRRTGHARGTRYHA